MTYQGERLASGRFLRPARQSIGIDEPRDIFEAREWARGLGAALGMETTDVILVTSAIYELCQCMLDHGGRGQLSIESITAHGRPGIRFKARNRGRGHTPPASLLDCFDGLGLAAVRRVMDVFEIATHGPSGWSVRAEKWARPALARKNEKWVTADSL